MKLLYCLACGDIKKLQVLDQQWCECGCSYGDMDKDGNSTYKSSAMIIQIKDDVLDTAIDEELRGRPYPSHEPGWALTCHLRPLKSKTDKRVGT